MTALHFFLLIPVAVIAIVIISAITQRGERIAWLPPTFIVEEFPGKPIRGAENGKFNIFIKRGIRYPAGALCQERAEWGFRWKKFLRPNMRELELLGHSVETVVVVRHNGVDRDFYDNYKAGILAEYYPQFAGMSREAIKAELIKWRPAAERWVDGHQSYVRWALELFA